MLSDDKNIENLRHLFVEFKRYLELQKEYTLLEVTEKLSRLLSMLLLVILIVLLSVVVLFYLSFTLVYAMAPLVGGLAESYALVAGLQLILLLILVLFRRKLIINPTVRFIASLFLEKTKNKRE